MGAAVRARVGPVGPVVSAASETMHVTVEVDTDELRRWADHHADAGNHGVAHVLYKAAKDGEALSEQALREARVEALREAADEMEAVIADGDVAEVAAHAPGEVGRSNVIAARDALYEEPNEWLRAYADRPA